MIEFAFGLAKLIEGICLTMFLIIFPITSIWGGSDEEKSRLAGMIGVGLSVLTVCTNEQSL